MDKGKFILPEEIVNPYPNAAMKLDRNVLLAFKQRVKNNQVREALEYLTRVIDVIIENIPEQTEVEVPEKPAARKPATKSTETTAVAE